MMPTQPVRVLILVSSFAIEGPLGGVARFVVELSRALDKQRVTPILGALWDYHTAADQRWRQRLQAEGFETVVGAPWDEDAPYRSCLAALQGLWRQAPSPVEVIHSHGEFTDLAAVALRRRLRARSLVRTVHVEIEWAKRPRFGRFFPNLLYPFTFDAELGVAQQVVENMNRRPLARWLQMPSLRMYNALNFSRFDQPTVDRAAKRQSLGFPTDAYVIGSVGRLTPQKGYGVLLEAVPLVLQGAPNAYFLIVGVGRLAAELEQQAHALGIAERVIFAGSREDIEEIYPAMDCFVSSSLWEGLPTVVMESMAAGVPVVATGVSGNTELVTDGETGVLVPVGQPAALAEGILRVIRQPEWARKLAAQAKVTARARFSIEAVAQQQAILYQRLAEKSSGHTRPGRA